MTLGEAIDLKLIDHTQTIVKSRKSNRYISLYQAIKSEGTAERGPFYSQKRSTASKKFLHKFSNQILFQPT